MKVLRGIGIALFSIALSISLYCLALSFTIRDVIQNQLAVETVKNTASKYVEDEKSRDEVNKVIDELSKDPEISKIIDTVLNDYVSYSTNGKEVDDKTVDMIINYIVNHKQEIEKISGETIDISEIDSEESRANLKKSINEGFEEINGENKETATTIISSYRTATSGESTKILIIIIIGIITIIALLSWSIYKWLKPVGIVGIVTSIFTLLTYGALTLLTTAIIKGSDINISLNSNCLLIAGIIEIVLGIGFIITTNIIDKRIKESQITTY